MTPPSFHHLVDEYLNARRGLGFGLETDEWFLRDFARHAERIGHSGPMTIELAVQWARSSSRSTNPAQAARRLAIVRQFARYRALIDPATEVPPAGLLGPASTRRSTPHIYTDAEIAALLQQARRLRPRGGLRPATYVAFFALLAATGLRLSEARRLTTDDADLVDGILTIRETKFRKSRLVPLHPTTTRALRRYADRRDAYAAPRSEYFFRTERSPRLIHATVEKTFRQIRRRLGWTAQGRTSQPRIHSLRHTFVVRRLLRWRQEGADVDRKILALATYLGHAGVAHTYWYCTAVPELLASTGQRFERFAHRASERPS